MGWNPFKDSWHINVFGQTGVVGKGYNKIVDLGENTADTFGFGPIRGKKRADAVAAAKATKDADAKAVLDAAVAAGQDILSRKRARTATIYRPYESTNQFTLGSSSRLGA